MRALLKPLAPLLLVALLLLAGYAEAPTRGDGAALHPAPGADGAPTAPATGDTVTVFVVWGTSNMCHPGRPLLGDEPESPDLDGRPAWEWFWRDILPDPEPPWEPIALEDPFPCYDSDGQTQHHRRGSAWPRFAIDFHDATGAAGTGHTLFMTSLAKGNSTSQWFRLQNFYQGGVTLVDSALAEAARLLPAHEVVFGGVMWNAAPGRFTDYPWAPYRDSLHLLLDAFGRDVVARHGGRFHFINTIIPREAHYSDTPALRQEYDYGLDLEADVCAAYPYCSMVQESVHIKEQQESCWGDPGAPDYTCEGWYQPPPPV